LFLAPQGKTMHGTENPSLWVQRWAHLIAPQSRVLDVACGAGRHMRFLAAQGHTASGVDRNPEAVSLAQAYGEVRCADIENGPWPFPGQTFGCVVVTNYLWRSLLPAIVQSVAPGGVLIYETFASGNETVGKPSRPDFLLQPGELLRVTEGMHVVAYEDGFEASPDRFVQRIVAARSNATGDTPRWALNPHADLAKVSP
jgi:SAM-dependent methyltransferase